MKNSKGLLFFILILLLVIGCGESEKKSQDGNNDIEITDEKKYEDNVEIAFNDENASDVWTDYVSLKNALVESNSNNAKNAAKELSSNFEENPRNAFKSFAVQIEESDDLEKQRQLFSDLTNQMEDYLKNEIDSGKIYKQFCPMAFDNKGAYWFSDEDAIRNPYFGNKMLKCGKVTETIGK